MVVRAVEITFYNAEIWDVEFYSLAISVKSNILHDGIL